MDGIPVTVLCSPTVKLYGSINAHLLKFKQLIFMSGEQKPRYRYILIE